MATQDAPSIPDSFPKLRKYTREQIEAEIARPKGKGGRPRKYATEEERAAAFAEANRRSYWRKKAKKEDGIVLGAEFELRKQERPTPEDKVCARREQNRQCYYAHHEEYKLYLAAHKIQCTVRNMVA